MIIQHLEQDLSVHLYDNHQLDASLVMDSFRTFVRLKNLLRCVYSYFSPAPLKISLKEPHSSFSEGSLSFYSLQEVID